MIQQSSRTQRLFAAALIAGASSLLRCWVMWSAAPLGRTGTNSAAASAAVADTFSNSNVITSTPVIALTLRRIAGFRANPPRLMTSEVLSTCASMRALNVCETTAIVMTAAADVASSATIANGRTMR